MAERNALSEHESMVETLCASLRPHFSEATVAAFADSLRAAYAAGYAAGECAGAASERTRWHATLADESDHQLELRTDTALCVYAVLQRLIGAVLDETERARLAAEYVKP